MNDDFDELKKFCEERGIKIFFEVDTLFNDAIFCDIENKLISINGNISENDIKNAIEYIENNHNI